jgi:hypothetical protein
MDAAQIRSRMQFAANRSAALYANALTGRLVSSTGYETAAVHNERGSNIVRRVIFVNHGVLGIIPIRQETTVIT